MAYKPRPKAFLILFYRAFCFGSIWFYHKIPKTTQEIGDSRLFMKWRITAGQMLLLLRVIQANKEGSVEHLIGEQVKV